MLFTIPNDQMTCLIKAGLLSETPECVCGSMNNLFSLLSLKFKIRPHKGSLVDKGENLSAPKHGGEAILGNHVRKRESVCARVCCQKFVTRAGKDKKGAAYFFPWRHEVLVGFEDVRQSFLDVFLLHAGQHSRGQEQ